MKIFVVVFGVVCFIATIHCHSISSSEENYHNKCQFPKEFNKKSKSCVCMASYAKGNCIGYEEFCEKRCCHCPYKKEPKIPHKDYMRWSQSKCNFVCKKSQPTTGCGNGFRWSKSRCKCIAIDTPTIAPTAAPTNPPTAAPTPPPKKERCDLWQTYNLDNSPALNGFSAGISAHRNAGNSTAWVAIGQLHLNHFPGRVQINGTTGSIFISDGDEVNTMSDDNSAYWWPGYPNFLIRVVTGFGDYLVVREGCSCTWKTPANYTGLVVLHDENDNVQYAIARINTTDNRVSIGKASIPAFATSYTDPFTGKQASIITAPEVLVCESSSDLSTKPTVKFANKACALWSRLDQSNIKWLESYGLPFGYNLNGSIGYVGRGYREDLEIAELVINGSSLTAYNIYFDYPTTAYPDFLVIPNNCFCEWVDINSALSRVGLIYIHGYRIENIGRYLFQDNQYSLAVFFGLTKGFETIRDNEINPSRANLLVCETV